MVQIVVKRVLLGVPIVIGVSILVFLVLHLLPGDPVAAVLAGAPATPKIVHNLELQFGLTKPLPVQYWHFAWHALHGDLGRDYVTEQPVASLIGSQLGATIQLTVSALILVVVFGIGGGLLAAAYRDTWVDQVLRLLSVSGSSMPLFWTGTMLIALFSFDVHLFPAAGSGSIRQVVLPAVALALLSSGIVVRLVRNSTIEVLGQPYVVALRAKGLRRREIMLKHVLRNAMIPTITMIGVQVGGLLAGTVIIETVFGRQGIGSLLVQAIVQKDYPLVQGLMLFISVIYVVVNLVVDVSLTYVDPRIRTMLTQRRA